MSQGWKNIPGWMNQGARDVYDEMVRDAKDGEAIVEIGVAVGRSIAYLARQVINSGKRIRIYAVDPWDYSPGNYNEHEALYAQYGGRFGAFCGMMLEHAREELNIINVIRGYSPRDTSRIEGPFAGVYVDGAHEYAPVLSDVSYWIARNPRIIAGDDHCPKEYPGVVEACEEIFGGSVESEAYELVNGWVWKKRLT